MKNLFNRRGFIALLATPLLAKFRKAEPIPMPPVVDEIWQGAPSPVVCSNPEWAISQFGFDVPVEVGSPVFAAISKNMLKASQDQRRILAMHIWGANDPSGQRPIIFSEMDEEDDSE